MKKDEKTKRTYEKILSAAMIEFGSKNYDNASLTAICNEYQISKGLLYHNFKSKDELYLKCVEICCQELLCYTSSVEYNSDNVKEKIKILLTKRQQFFQDNPYYANIFFNALLYPPNHLKQDIQNIKQELDSFIRECYRKIFEKMELREGITIDLVVEYFIVFQEMFNAYYRNKNNNTNNFHAIVLEHEHNLSKFLDIILYGIIQK